MAKIGTQAVLGDDIHFTAQQIFQFQFELNQIQEISIGFEADE